MNQGTSYQTISISLPNAWMEDLQKEVEKTGLTQTEILRLAIGQYLGSSHHALQARFTALEESVKTLRQQLTNTQRSTLSVLPLTARVEALERIIWHSVPPVPLGGDPHQGDNVLEQTALDAIESAAHALYRPVVDRLQEDFAAETSAGATRATLHSQSSLAPLYASQHDEDESAEDEPDEILTDFLPRSED